ncbi:aminoacetone oxidase family FAD-binding enzyme [Candidatus Peregrinibacteria bacterium CG_4_10_14_0_2_um_filter_38_24]|nr:MAG: aminoacetone oxidase family FAD-binding enzyme [Candidatus Peregrinibacteria bacterium CG_4_10_14_0_2_um_filter_38_24]PJC39369.1 MAG: aminoacetone oxidase family FAD-binding enzyme [Candidatus Peregrinibacteria bacterium CG_4_9_14_0_2_um_filter_38_9]
MKIGIIGAGAAGMMAAATIAENSQGGADVFLIEKNAEIGKKVEITGGGRCNVTTGLRDDKEVLKKYPRGANFLKLAMHNFSPEDVFKWVASHGVPLKIEDDMRVFPKSNDGKDITKLFGEIFEKKKVNVLLKHNVAEVGIRNEKFYTKLLDGQNIVFDFLLLTTGGNAYSHTGSTGDGYNFAKALGHRITQLSPSLHAFSFTEKYVKDLAGISFTNANLKIKGEKSYEFNGPFLFTHKGITGPAVFALSSMAAHEKFDNGETSLFIDFFPEKKYEEVFEDLNRGISENPKKEFINVFRTFVPKALAEMMCELAEVGKKKCPEISKKDLNKLTEFLKNMKFNISGKTPSEEFVTAGGVDLRNVDAKTMESKICPNLYFAGEILDIDGFTGGFNLQSAWATGRLAGENITKKIK